MSDTIADLTNLVLDFRAERDWRQFHNPKDMALSLVLESAEFMELMQWRSGAELDEHLLSPAQIEPAQEMLDDPVVAELREHLELER